MSDELTLNDNNTYSDEENFRGNSFLRDSDTPSFVSEEEFKKYTVEILKCARDPIYFAKKYFTIISGKGRHIIDTYPKQEELLWNLYKYNFNISLAARQAGKCVFSNTLVTVRNKITNKIETLTIDEFKKRF
jgi:hypothetical protein